MSLQAQEEFLDASKMALSQNSMREEYITGECTFLGRTFNVKSPVMIPAAHSERMVERIGETEDRASRGCFLEVGPGCGAICLSLLKSFPQMRCVAVDISIEAYNETMGNAIKHGLSERIDLLNIPINQYPVTASTSKFDFIVSNPPYHADGYYNPRAAKLLKYTSDAAIYSGPEGVDVMMEILHLGKDLLISGGSIYIKMKSQQPVILDRKVKATPELCSAFGPSLVYPDTQNKARVVYHIRRL